MKGLVVFYNVVASVIEFVCLQRRNKQICRYSGHCLYSVVYILASATTTPPKTSIQSPNKLISTKCFDTAKLAKLNTLIDSRIYTFWYNANKLFLVLWFIVHDANVWWPRTAIKDHGTKTGLDTVSTTKDDVTYQRFSEFVGNDHFRPG